MDYAKLGKKIKKRRERTGLNQTELAAKLGISQGAMSRIELGTRRLTLKEVPIVSQALSAPYWWFFQDRAPRYE